jgi:hypothetical protein
MRKLDTKKCMEGLSSGEKLLKQKLTTRSK